MSRIKKYIETKGRLVVTEYGVLERKWKLTFWFDNNILKLIVIMVAQFCEQMKSH